MRIEKVRQHWYLFNLKDRFIFMCKWRPLQVFIFDDPATGFIETSTLKYSKISIKHELKSLFNVLNNLEIV